MGQVLRIGMRSDALVRHRTAYNHFLSLNTPCFAMEEGRMKVDYGHLVVAAGSVAPVGFGAPHAATLPTDIVVDFERNPLQLSASGDDLVYLYAWCPGVGEGKLSTPAYRRTRQATIALPERWTGMEVHLYGFVVDNEAQSSDSVYLGSLADEMALVGAGCEECRCGEDKQQQQGCEENLPEADAEGQSQHCGGGSREGDEGEPLCQCPVGTLYQQGDEQQGDEQRREQQEDPLQGVGVAVETRRQSGEESPIEQVAQQEEEQEKACHKRQVDGRKALHRLVDKGDRGVVLRRGFGTFGGDGAGGLLFSRLGKEVRVGGLYATDGGGGQDGPQHQLGNGCQGYAADFSHHELHRMERRGYDFGHACGFLFLNTAHHLHTEDH